MAEFEVYRERFEKRVKGWANFRDEFLVRDRNHPDYYKNSIVQASWEGYKHCLADKLDLMATYATRDAENPPQGMVHVGWAYEHHYYDGNSAPRWHYSVDKYNPLKAHDEVDITEFRNLRPLFAHKDSP